MHIQNQDFLKIVLCLDFDMRVIWAKFVSKLSRFFKPLCYCMTSVNPDIIGAISLKKS